MPDDFRNWDELLDNFNERVDLAREALESGSPLDPRLLEPWSPPPDFPPMPERCMDRAIETLGRYAEIEQQFREAIDAIDRNISRSAQAAHNSQNRFGGRGKPSEPVISRYVDRSV